jgi:hypothetical protein
MGKRGQIRTYTVSEWASEIEPHVIDEAVENCLARIRTKAWFDFTLSSHGGYLKVLNIAITPTNNCCVVTVTAIPVNPEEFKYGQE